MVALPREPDRLKKGLAAQYLYIVLYNTAKQGTS